MVAINEILLPECTGEECGGDNEVCTDSRVHRGNAENRAPVTRNHRSAPILGRWMEQDPAQYINGANTYQFVDSSPVAGADPMGDKLITVAFEGLFGDGSAKLPNTTTFYGGHHPGGKPNQLLNGFSFPYLNRFLISTHAWQRKDTIVKYYPEYSIGRAVSQVTPLLTKRIGGSGPDRCKYNTILVVGFSNGGKALAGAAAAPITPRPDQPATPRLGPPS